MPRPKQKPNYLPTLDQIKIGDGIQVRSAIHEDVVTDYAARLDAGDKFPPVVVFNDGTDFWLADGFHRVLAATRLKLEFIAVKVIKGTQDDAVWYALGANRTNGLRLSAAEKHAAVE